MTTHFLINLSKTSSRPIEAHKRLRVSNLLIKAYDVADYTNHRARLYLSGLRLRWKRQRLLGNDVGRILVVRLSSLGDVVRTTAVLSGLRSQYPTAQIDFLTSSTAAQLVDGHPCVRRVLTLEQLPELSGYDWVINLQRSEPPAGFLKGTELSWRDVLYRISGIACRFYTGRRIVAGEDRPSHVDIWYCNSELEELFHVALLPYRESQVSKVSVRHIVDTTCTKKLELDRPRPRLGIFLGTGLVGDHDGGFRSYTVNYLGKLIRRFSHRFTIYVFGLSASKTAIEMQQYREILRRHPTVVDLVDKTSVEELVQLISGMDVVISSESGPLHIALALKVPVVGLFTNRGSFAINGELVGPLFVSLNSFEPCFKYNWRWKFFCRACKDQHYRMYHCNLRDFEFKQDLLPIERVAEAVTKLTGVLVTSEDSVGM